MSEMELSPEIEGVRQRVLGLMQMEDHAKKNCPNGKVYKGIKFVRVDEDNFPSWKAVPVYEKKPRTGEKG